MPKSTTKLSYIKELCASLTDTLQTLTKQSNMDRQEYKSNAPWEDKLGYCRAVKVGQIIEVAGTTSVNENGQTVGDNYFEQTNFILNKIEKALQNFNTDRNSITRTRIFVIDIEKWEEVAKAHSAFFVNNKPVCTLVEVSKLIQKDLLIEIEVSAILNKIV